MKQAQDLPWIGDEDPSLIDDIKQLLASEWEQPLASITEEDVQMYLAQLLAETTETTIPLLFSQQVAQSPAANAITFPADHTLTHAYQQMTYAELNQRVNDVSYHLQRTAFQPHKIVGIYMERTPDLAVAILGVLKAGGTFMLLSPADPLLRTSHLLTTVSVSLILTQSYLYEEIATTSEIPMICVDERGFGDKETTTTSEVTHEAMAVAGGNAYIVFAMDKGMAIPQLGLLAQLQWLQDTYHLTAADAILSKAALTSDTVIWEILWPLLYGGRLVLPVPGAEHDSHYWQRLVGQQSVNVLHLDQAELTAMLNLSQEDETAFGSLRCALLRGKLPPLALVNRFRQQFDCLLAYQYGPPEAASDVATIIYSDAVDNPAYTQAALTGNVSVYILDKYRQLAPIGVTGELYLGGVGMADGYLNSPQETSQRFVEVVLADAMGPQMLFRTGDYGRMLPDGTLALTEPPDQPTNGRVQRGEVDKLTPHSPAPQDNLPLVVTATFTADLLQNAFQFWSDKLTLPLDIHFAPFGQVFQQLLDKTSMTAQNKKGINIILVRLEDWSGSEVNQFAQNIEKNINAFLQALCTSPANEGFSFICLCPHSDQVQQNSDALDFLQRMADKCAQALAEVKHVRWLDAREIGNTYQLNDVNDPLADKLAHIPYTALFFATLGTFLMRRISTLLTQRQTVIVLDEAHSQTLNETWLTYFTNQMHLGKYIGISARKETGYTFTVLNRQGEKLVPFTTRQSDSAHIAVGLRRLSQHLNVPLAEFIYLSSHPSRYHEVQKGCPDLLAIPYSAHSKDILPFLDHLWVFDKQ